MSNVIPIKKAQDAKSDRLVAELSDMNRARMAIDVLKASDNGMIKYAVKLLTEVCNDAQRTTISSDSSAEVNCRHEWQYSAAERWCNLCGKGV